jgi:uncharacterized RDD family membrane protein YckC
VQSRYNVSSQAAATALEYVGVGRRLLAFVIDVVILLVIQYWITNLILGKYFPSGGAAQVGNDPGVRYVDNLSHMEPSAVLTLVIPIIVFFAYYIVMEALLGATVGKWILGIRVVSLDGSSIGLGKAVVRNLLRIVDQFPYAIPYLLGAILTWTSSRKQRLGDRVARTVVVYRR